MEQDPFLRPLERRVLDLTRAGVDEVEIAWRLRRSPKAVRQIVALAQVPRREPVPPAGAGLRPLERRVLHLRGMGAEFEDLAPRFRHRPDFLRQVEVLAQYKLARS